MAKRLPSGLEAVAPLSRSGRAAAAWLHGSCAAAALNLIYSAAGRQRRRSCRAAAAPLRAGRAALAHGTLTHAWRTQVRPQVREWDSNDKKRWTCILAIQILESIDRTMMRQTHVGQPRALDWQYVPPTATSLDR